jgi:hypothetical protein
MKKILSIPVVLVCCLLFLGMNSNAQICSINTKVYVKSSLYLGPCTLQIAIERYDGTVFNPSNVTSGGPFYFNTEYTVQPNPWFFSNIPWPVQPPVTNYCRIWMSATYNGTTQYGYSDWLTPDNYGYVYPDVIKIDFN